MAELRATVSHAEWVEWRSYYRVKAQRAQMDSKQQRRR